MIKSLSRYIGCASLVLLASCEKATIASEGIDFKAAALGETPSVHVDVGQRLQRISGFGASSAWTTPGVSATQADFLFRPEGDGLGLSLLRLRIAPDGNSSEVLTAVRAAERGVGVWAAPWSPPGIWKTNGTDNNGGSLKPEYYQAWADRLAAFAGAMRTRGVPLVALSAQNEPDWVAEWETCIWTPEEMRTFVRDYLAPAVRKTSPTTKVMAPESANWDSLETYADTLLADTGARDAVGIIATHSYGGIARPYPAAAQAGKEFWQTEISYHSSDGISAALGTARMIHTHLTLAEVHAWHYWWINSDSNTSLYQDGTLLPQAYGLGHYSKFIRPGYHRVSAEPRSPVTGVLVSAFVDPSSPRTVVVAINDSASPVLQRFEFGATQIGPLTPWTTKEGSSLVQSAAIAGGQNFEYELPASSIVSFVTDRVVQGTGGSTGNGSGGVANAGGAGGDASGGDQGGEAGSGGTPTSQSGGVTGQGGAAARGGTTGAGGRTINIAGRGGTPSGSGGHTPEGGAHSDNRGGTAAVGHLPEEPFLPGCYCATAPAPSRGNSPLAPAMAAIVSLRALSRARRKRAERR
ncbi:MAG: glycoside hydrolase family 30 protein [Myxococcota bacterium]